MKPDLSRIGSWYHGYIGLVPETDIADAFKKQGSLMFDFFETIPKVKRHYRYAAGKWDLFQMLQHIIDAERIFAYRALRLARKDSTPLPGFDENPYAENSRADKREWGSLLEEMKVVRKSSELLYNTFEADTLELSGTISNSPAYVLAIGYIIIGHPIHHQNIIKERYL